MKKRYHTGRKGLDFEFARYYSDQSKRPHYAVLVRRSGSTTPFIPYPLCIYTTHASIDVGRVYDWHTVTPDPEAAGEYIVRRHETFKAARKHVENILIAHPGRPR